MRYWPTVGRRPGYSGDAFFQDRVSVGFDDIAGDDLRWERQWRREERHRERDNWTNSDMAEVGREITGQQR